MADVVVIGGGASGLACARRLREAGCDALILEARNRLGGRIRTHRWSENEAVELGALMVHGERASIVPVIEEAGLHITSGGGGGGGAAVVIDGGDVIPATKALAAAGVGGLWSMESAVAALDAGDVPLATELTARGWEPGRVRYGLELFEQIWCADPQRLSAQGVARVEGAWTSGHANFSIAEGYDALVAHLASGLDVELGVAVRNVRWSKSRASVEGVDGRVHEASAVVITAPPSIVADNDIALDPPLPVAKMRAASSIPIGPLIRVAILLKQPAPAGAWVMVLGAGWWSVRAGSKTLTGWIGGPPAERFSGRPISELLATVKPALPWLDDASIEDVVIADWAADPFSRGGYSYPGVGALDAPLLWAQPVEDTLFFAGEATCGDVHPATVHGAYDSGVRAAEEVLRILDAA